MSIKQLEGQVIVRMSPTNPKQGDDYILFVTDSGKTYRMWHSQDCCESVSLEDVCGDWQDIIGLPVLHADESTSYERQENSSEYQRPNDSFTWTFYRIMTLMGSVTLRWYGESKGYYSERVDFGEI